MTIEKIWILELEEGADNTSEAVGEDGTTTWVSSDQASLKALPVVREYLWDNKDIPRIPSRNDCILLIEGYTQDYEYLLEWLSEQEIPFANMYSLPNQAFLLEKALEKSDGAGKIKSLQSTNKP